MDGQEEPALASIAPIRPPRGSVLAAAIVTVPLILGLGFLSGRLVPSGSENGWYVALTKPALTPPGIVFPIMWTILYVLLGIALAMIVAARGAPGRGRAIALFAIQFAGALGWTPLFFGAHRVQAAMWLIVFMVVAASATALAFSRIRRTAGRLMLPYLVWIGFAGVLTWSIDRLNPDAESLAPATATSQMP